MRAFLVLPAFALLAACGGQRDQFATFTCPNGPTLVVAYTENGARITFPDGRVEQLANTGTENLYAKPGVVFDARVFRTARLTDGERSYSCDQMAG